jgi:hypothetical protein
MSQTVATGFIPTRGSKRNHAQHRETYTQLLAGIALACGMGAWYRRSVAAWGNGTSSFEMLTAHLRDHTGRLNTRG